MGRLRGRVALVTGGSRGIGRGIALCLAEEGADIVVNYLSHPEDAKEVAAAVEERGQRTFLWNTDVADPSAVEEMFTRAIEHFGRVDIVVANSALETRALVVDAEWETALRTIEVTQFGVFHTCQTGAKHMLNQGIRGRSAGKIVVISSIVTEIALPRMAAYSMSKAAINHFALTLAAELAPYHINVNVVAPGWTDTPGERRFYSEEELREGAKQIPWSRLGTPEDIGRAVAFLVSDDADYVTGATLRVDGGFLVGMRAAAQP